MSVYKQLARRVRSIAAEAAASAAPTVERWKVTGVEPLVLEEVAGDGVLEEGDPDFEVERWLRRYDEDEGLEKGDVLYVLYDGETWIAVGVAEGGD